MKRTTSVLILLFFGVIIKGVSVCVSGWISDVWPSVQEYLGDSDPKKAHFLVMTLKPAKALPKANPY